jgi:hypothetical protein
MWEDTVITVGHLASSPVMTDVAQAGPAVYFGPYRNFFNRDVTITIPYDTEIGRCQALKPYIYNHLTKTWDELKAESYGNGLLTFKTQVLGLFRAGISNTTSLCSISGKVSGDIQEGINVEINVYSCGAPQSVATLTTDASGYYSIGNLENGQYGIIPQKDGYSFIPKYLFPQIPQTEIQSYDFTAAEIVSCGSIQ